MAARDLEVRVEAVRRFNRFYTRKIGVLHEGLLQSPFSLAEMRVLYELAHREQPTAGELVRDLGLDPGYMSRILARFAKDGLVEKVLSGTDGRRNLLRLTDEGRRTFAPLNARAREEVGAILTGHSPDEQDRLVAAMATIEGLLGVRPEGDPPYLLRPHRPGDIGWVVALHGTVYAREYGWDDTFEALVAEIGAKFLRNFDLKRERCWIAERNGEKVGSVFLVKQTESSAKLRLLIVDPKARGLGIGGHLVRECIDFAGMAGYRKLTLWTNSVLDAARRIYEAAGFNLVREEPHTSFGHDLVGQYWELKL
ncbi:MAG TPA: bifunctional helix-turn-helix transcriptional regulator/GNAT family N-acetyltransferase [Alphaproteobacteria bacterium]|nr:bifunctional helix-turn-helix transcriptional regulator/GNAT family N-acetyltransferase [Alphaproteobacteria bacterium]